MNQSIKIHTSDPFTLKGFVFFVKGLLIFTNFT
jgi:hypothetical protein